jgi:hypothetical protein
MATHHAARPRRGSTGIASVVQNTGVFVLSKAPVSILTKILPLTSASDACPTIIVEMSDSRVHIGRQGCTMRNRFTIQTTEELDRALEEIRLVTGRATKSEVIRDGLDLYDLVVQHLMAGKRLYLGATRESAGEVLLPHLERAAGRLRPSLAIVQRDAESAPPSPGPTLHRESAPVAATKPPAAPRSSTAKRGSDSL